MLELSVRYTPTDEITVSQRKRGVDGYVSEDDRHLSVLAKHSFCVVTTG